MIYLQDMCTHFKKSLIVKLATKMNKRTQHQSQSLHSISLEVPADLLGTSRIAWIVTVIHFNLGWVVIPAIYCLRYGHASCSDIIPCSFTFSLNVNQAWVQEIPISCGIVVNDHAHLLFKGLKVLHTHAQVHLPIILFYLIFVFINSFIHSFIHSFLYLFIY